MDPRILSPRSRWPRLARWSLAIIALGLLLGAIAPSFGSAAGPPAAGAGQAPRPDARELPSLRTANTRTFANPDGTRSTEIRTDALNYRTPAGAWAPIENRFVPDTAPGIAFRNAANSFQVSLPKSIAAPVRVEEDGAWMSFALEGARPSQPSVTGADTARYADVFPGVDVEYALRGGALKENVVLAGPESRSSFTYRLRLAPGLQAQVGPQGTVEILDGQGERKFLLAPPVLEDSSGTPAGFSSAVEVTLTREGAAYQLTYAADPGWLSSPEREWPVRLDPTVIFNAYHSYVVQGGITYDLDCFITDAPPTTTRCANTTNAVGFNGTNKYRTAAIFPLSSGGNSGLVIPGDAEILDGWLLMKPTGTVPATLSVHEVTSNWNSTVATWTKATSTINWTSAGGDFKAEPADAAGATRPSVNCTAPGSYCGWHEWSVTDEVQGWIRSATSNRGLLIKQVNESQAALASFGSSNGTAANVPTLWINYRPAPIGAYPADEFVGGALNDRMAIQANVATGNLMVQATDLALAGTGLDLAISRTYNSRSEGPSPNLGEDWMLDASLDVGLLVFPDGNATVFGPSGYAANFHRRPDGSYRAPARLDATLVTDLASTGTLTFNDTGEVYRFQGGTLLAHEDRHGNAITFETSTTPSLTTITDTQGRVIEADHDSAGRIVTLTLPAADPLDPPLREIAYRYDSNGRLDRFTDAAGNHTDYAYNGSGELVTITDPLGNETQITYATTSWGRKVASISRVLNPTGPVLATTSFTYSSDVSACPVSGVGAPPAAGKTTVTGPTGHATTYCWDAANRATKVSDAALSGTATWTGADTPAQLTTPGGTTSNEYYAGDLLLQKTTDPTGAKTQFVYGAPSAPHDPTKVTDPQGVVTFYAYDADGNQCLVRHDRAPQGADLCADTTGAFAHLTYNANGTLASATDANGNTTTYGYDTFGRLTSITPPSPLGAEARTYDDLSRPATVTDGKGQTTTYSYDTLDRTTLVEHDDSSQVSYSYDDNGNLLTQTDGAGATTRAYDRLGRLTTETPPTGPQVTYAYDGAGNLTSLTDGGGAVSYQYAGTAGRLSSITQPDSSQITFGYDADGNRNQVSYPNGVVLATVFDGGGKKTSVTATKGATTLSSFAYDFDIASLPTEVVQTETDMNGAITSYTYASPGRLTRAQTKNSGGTVTADYQYAYDAAGNRTSQDVNGVQTTYSYNAASQLTQAGSTTYTYDANGNLTGSSAGFGAAYNAKDQTSSVTPAGGSAVAMGYRGTGQTDRTQAGVISMGLNSLGMASTSDLSGDRYYTRTPDGDLLAQRSASGTLYYLADARGSITGLTDGTGALVATYRYDPFGNTTASTGVVSNRWRFAGEFFDADTGLYKIGARFYDPSVGRWTQQDHILAVADVRQSNPYVYVGADPVNFFDPTGFATVRDQGCVAALKKAGKIVPQTACWKSDLGLGPIGRWIVSRPIVKEGRRFYQDNKSFIRNNGVTGAVGAACGAGALAFTRNPGAASLAVGVCSAVAHGAIETLKNPPRAR